MRIQVIINLIRTSNVVTYMPFLPKKPADLDLEKILIKRLKRLILEQERRKKKSIDILLNQYKTSLEKSKDIKSLDFQNFEKCLYVF